MGNQCKICGIQSILYLWSSSRYFNRNKVLLTRGKDVKKYDEVTIMKDDYVVCLWCVEENGLMER